MSTLDAITLSIAVLGAVLGIVNTWHALSLRMVRLVVRPSAAVRIGAGAFKSTIHVPPPGTVADLCIEVTNLSAFAVTIDEVGLLPRRGKVRQAIPRPILADGGAWPRRLQPRESVSTYCDPGSVADTVQVKCAYATTACGHTAKASSPALRALFDRSTTLV
jgi:hypothetical protein